MGWDGFGVRRFGIGSFCGLGFQWASFINYMYQFKLFLFMKKSTVMLGAIFGTLLMGCSDEEIANVETISGVRLTRPRPEDTHWGGYQFVKAGCH